MLTANPNQVEMSLDDARDVAANRKALFVVTDWSDLQNISGYITYFSQSIDSLDELIGEYDKVRDSGKQAIVIGCYDGDFAGVSFEA